MKDKFWKFHFADGKAVDVDLDEFGEDGMGAVVDRLAVIHGGLVKLEPYGGPADDQSGWKVA